MKSLQTKIISLIICCTLLTASIVLIIGYRKTKEALHKDSGQIVQLLCSDTAAELNKTLQHVEQSVNTIYNFASKRLDEIGDSLLTDDAVFSAYMEEIHQIALNVAEYTPGSLAFYYRFNPELPVPSPGFFMTKLNGQTQFSNAPLTDLSMYSPEDTAHTVWYYKPIDRGGPTWIDPYYNANLDTWMISYVIPVFSGNTVIGVIGMDISTEILQAIAASVSVYDTGYAILLDNNDSIVYHPDYPTGLQQGGYTGELSEIMRLLEDFSEETQVFHYEWEGEDNRAAATHLENGMPFVISVPIDEITSPIKSLLFQVILSVVLILASILPVTVWAVRRVTTPLKQLTIAAQKISRGDLDVIIKCNTKDEISTLAKSFQQTANSLKEHIGYINRLAYTDSLTGVRNKTSYDQMVPLINNSIKTGDASFAIVLMDLNDLKKVNDTYGHETGNTMITDSSGLMERVFGSENVYRIGGDEFVILLTGENIQQRGELVKDFINEISQFNHSPGKQYEQELQIAIGVALYEPEQDKCFQDVFRRADDLMYKNKKELKRQHSLS